LVARTLCSNVEPGQCTLSKVIDLNWSIRNVASGRYLGMEPDDRVSSRHELREVEHCFLWHPRRGNPDSCVRYANVNPHYRSLSHAELSISLQFVVVQVENGWAFRNAKTKAFLALTHSVAPFHEGNRLQCVKSAFTWVVLPHHEDRSKFK
jgi:hypothetical protein